MKRYTHKLSFRTKILTILLLITLLLSGFSLILVQSIDEMSTVSQKIEDNNIPELVWLSYWEEELNTKEYLVKTYVADDFCCNFIERYYTYKLEDYKSLDEELTLPPKSLENVQTSIELLDFKIMNNVQGLLLYGDKEAARRYIESEYQPHLDEIKKDLDAREEEVFSSLSAHSRKFPVIIKESLWLLLLLTAGAIGLSIYFSFRISANLTKPIENMIDKVDDIATGSYGLRIPNTNQLELNSLTTSINEMSLRLKDSFYTIINDKIYREQILDSLPAGIITIDNSANFSINTAAKTLLKIENEQGIEIHRASGENQSFWEIFNSKVICQNVKVPFEDKHLLVSQTQLFDQSNEVIGRIFYFIDITETDSLEKRIHHSQKLAFVGEMAAGAAHEIRNPLAVIHGFLSLMNQSITDEELSKYHLPLVMKEIERINSIIEDMLLLSRPGAPIVRKTLMEDITKDILPLIIQSSNKKIDFTIDLDQVPLNVDVKQMKQVFHNLIRNCIEALKHKGHISIKSKIEDDYYHIFISDNGTGIPIEIKQSIYDPFLSSKEGGTGLGLTIVQRIIENHRGSIELVSSSEKGTTFKMSLPINER
ncbi:ATP-binding protein [Metabacillus herbersteinensis]|uniref:histidine kinase n=1 Tax=Metabacillus herbersteinensis TaxID=283816 RepID=A0ABV6GGX2_9BACI